MKRNVTVIQAWGVSLNMACTARNALLFESYKSSGPQKKKDGEIGKIYLN